MDLTGVATAAAGGGGVEAVVAGGAAVVAAAEVVAGQRRPVELAHVGGVGGRVVVGAAVGAAEGHALPWLHPLVQILQRRVPF